MIYRKPFRVFTKQTGLATYTFANGTVDKGIWKNNKLIERRNL